MLITDASNLPRLLACNGSRLMKPDPVYIERDNTIREEGNAAHWLASAVFFGKHTTEEMVDRKAPNGVYITADMAEHVNDYLSAIDRSPNAIKLMEWSYSLNGSNWQINGRGDFIGIDGSLLNVDDFKYGYSIVEPQNNWTLISHAIGYCISTGFQPRAVTFTIHQPRAPHHAGRVREHSIMYDELCEKYNQMSAILANPSDILVTGSHCYKCPSFGGCPARQNAELNAIETSHVAYNAEIDNTDLAARLDQIRRAQELLKQSEKAYTELASHRVQNGQIVANYYLENDLTNRVWKDGMTPELLQAFTGKDIAKRQLPTPRQAEQAGIPEDIVALWSERRNKGKKLVRIDANKKAKKLFGEK